MATQQEFVDDLVDRLNDVGHTQVPLTTKTRFLNRGMAAMFPRIFKTARDNATLLVANQFEYQLPSAQRKGKLLIAEVETAVASNRYSRLGRYDIVASGTDPLLVLLDSALPSAAGSKLRFTSAVPMTPFTSNMADVYDGPDGTEELPILYAMGLATARALDDRMDYQRYSVTNQVAGVDSSDIMTTSQFWFAQFELLLDRFALPLPAAGN